MKKNLTPVLVAFIWISISEFLRNEFLFKDLWINHFTTMGISFPSSTINGAIWGLWSLLFAIFITLISKKFTLLQSTFISWFAGFVLMWIALGNLGVLPYSLLTFAIPLSILESFIAVYIVTYLSKKQTN